MHKDDKLKIAVLRSAELMQEHGLGKWKIKLNRKRIALATTKHDARTIEYSRYFLLVADKKDLDGVTLHEIAHAMLGPGKGHGQEFRELCAEISPTTDYITHGSNTIISKYIYSCPTCTYTYPSNIIHDSVCVECSLAGFEIIPLVRNRNTLQVVEW